MSVYYFSVKNQLSVFFALIIALITVFTFSCTRSTEEQPVTPPATHPLARDYIGYGVVNVSFTNLLNENGPNAVSRGYIRRGTVIRIIERAQVNNRGKIESWVLGESNYQPSGTSGAGSGGWLRESALLVFDNESQANTASKTMSQ
jgi:hypothetical protein